MNLWPRRFRIRRLQAGDAGQWHDLRSEARDSHPDAFGATHDEWAGTPLSELESYLQLSCVFGAFRDALMVGCMALDTTQSFGEISGVYVRPGWRGKGVARTLLKAVEKEARQRSLSGLTLTVAKTNAPAMSFYLSAGFVETQKASRALARDGRLLDLIAMTKAL